MPIAEELVAAMIEEEPVAATIAEEPVAVTIAVETVAATVAEEANALSIVEVGAISKAPTSDKKKKKKNKKNKKNSKPSLAHDDAVNPTLGDVYVTGTLMKIEEEGRCGKCGDMVKRSMAKLSGKQKSYWVCKTCHSRCSQLYQIFGSWPPANFKTLSAEKKSQFHESIKTVYGKKSLKLHTTNFFRTTLENSKGTQDKKEFLPLSVWKSRGFNVRRIKKRCKDIQRHSLARIPSTQIHTQTYQTQ